MGSSATLAPSAAGRRSTSKYWPRSTRYCLPPVFTIAYMVYSGDCALAAERRRPPLRPRRRGLDDRPSSASSGASPLDDTTATGSGSGSTAAGSGLASPLALAPPPSRASPSALASLSTLLSPSALVGGSTLARGLRGARLRLGGAAG